MPAELIVADEDLGNRLPLPLAQLYRRACNAKSSLDRHQAAFYLWEASLKLLGSVCVVEYVRLERHDNALDESLRSLARPAVGHWWEFVRRLTPVLADRGVGGFQAVRDLLLGRRRDDLPRVAGLESALRQVLEGTTAARAAVSPAELFDRLLRYRNQEFGHGVAGQRGGEFYERLGRSLLLGMAELLGKLDVLAGRTLLYVAEVRQVRGAWRVERYELVGEVAKRLEPVDLPRDQAGRLPDGERVYLELAEGDEGQVLTALHPLLVYDLEANECAFLHARRGKAKADYLCYTSGQTRQHAELLGEQRALLARALGIATVSEEQAGAWARQSQDEEPEVGPTPASGRRRLGEFELLSELGRGEMGVVYRAWQPSLGRQVAVKALAGTGDARAEARFRREIRALGQVEHPNVVKIFTSGSDGDQWFYVMELVEGAPLSAVWSALHTRSASATEVDLPAWEQAVSSACSQAREGEKPWSDPPPAKQPPAVSLAPASPDSLVRPGAGYVRQVVALMRQVAEAAEALHRRGIVHRHIKPGNILVNAAGDHATLMALGLAQVADDVEGELTRTGHFVGTLPYASPEQLLGVTPVDGRSDVYSLGATLWELLALRPLFGATEQTPHLILRIAREEPQRLRECHPGVGRDLEAIVHKCLEKEANRRYQTARELADDLRRWLDGEPVQARPVGDFERALRWMRRRPAVVGFSLALVLGAAVAMWLGWALESDLRAERLYSQQLEAQLREAGIRPIDRPLTPPLRSDVHTPPTGPDLSAWACGGLFIIISAVQVAVIVWLLVQRRFVARPADTAAPGPLPPPRRLRFEPGEAFSSQTVVLHYPAPIAIAYRRFTWSNDPKDQLFRLFLTFQATLRYLVTLGLSDLFHCKVQGTGSVDPLPKNQAFDLLRRPTRMTLGQWVQTLRETARILSRKPDRFVRELPEVCQPGGFLEQDFFHWITDSRNDQFHPDAELPHSPDECRQVLKEARPRLERLLQEIQFVRNYPLGFVTPGYTSEDDPTVGHYRAHSGMGARAAFGEGMFVLETPARLPVSHPFIIAPDGDRLLYLWPLLLQRESDKTQRGSLYVFETISERSEFLAKAEFAAIDHHDTWTATLHDDAKSHDWLWEALRRLPAAVTIDPLLNLVERLAYPLVGTLAGEILGPYRLSRAIAKGGFGTVYDAVDTRDSSRVAVKVLEVPDGLRPQDQENLFKRFRQEFAALQSACKGCCHIIRCFERNVTPKGNRYYPWYSMEFAAGGDLTARLLARRAGLGRASIWDRPPLRAEAVAEFRAVARAVAHLHDLGFVHRDIKPGNILIVEEGGGSVVKLSDFGLIKELEQSHGFTTTGALMGTRGYMAPEQERGGSVGAPADIYALGILLAELATGHPPVPDLLAPAGSRIEGDVGVDRLPDPLRQLIVRCTDLNPTRRPEKARYVLSDFEAFAGPA